MLPTHFKAILTRMCQRNRGRAGKEIVKKWADIDLKWDSTLTL